MTIRILIVDDHELTSMGLQLALSRWEGYEICGVLGAGKGVPTFVRENQVDVIILDIQLPDMLGTSLLVELVGGLDATVMVLSGSDDAKIFDLARKLGARALMSKTDPVEDILKALETVVAGGEVVSETVQDLLKSALASSVELSPRQIAILHLLDIGESNKEIAYRLKISAPTVSFHLKELRTKLGLQSNKKILPRARELNLI